MNKISLGWFFLAITILHPSFSAAAADTELSQAADETQVAWLRDAATPIRSIAPDNDDFSDLKPFGAALAGARVVLLGEADHGDGNTFLVKSRLVRFLHQEQGFDVLAFESGFYDCWKAWQDIEAGGDPATVFSQSIFYIWSRSVQVQSLIEYISTAAHTPRPLVLAGIDPQFTGKISEQNLLTDLLRLADAVGMPVDRIERISPTLANLVEGKYESGEIPEPADRALLIETLKEMEGRLRRSGKEVTERNFWLRWFASIGDFADVSWRTDWTRSLIENPGDFAVRDRLMGEQLVWLARERFPGRKIIVWLHSAHSARGLARVEVESPVHTRLYQTFLPAGHVAHAQLGKEIYSVGFLAYQGRYSNLRGPVPKDIPPPTGGSLEDLFHRTGHAYAFIDLSRSDRLPPWLRGPLISRPISYIEMRARWQEVYDGLIFLDRMETSEKVPRTAN